MPSNHTSEYNFDEDILLADGGTLRDFVQGILSAPEIDLVPGGDRIDTVIAVIAAHAEEVAAHDRYRRWVQTVRYLEDCLWLTPEGCPLGLGLQRQRVRRRGVGRLSSWVWSDADGPVLAIHSERGRGRVKRYTWTRVHGLEPVPPEDRARARKAHAGRSPKGVATVLLKLASFIA